MLRYFNRAVAVRSKKTAVTTMKAWKCRRGLIRKIFWTTRLCFFFDSQAWSLYLFLLLITRYDPCFFYLLLLFPDFAERLLNFSHRSLLWLQVFPFARVAVSAQHDVLKMEDRKVPVAVRTYLTELKILSPGMACRLQISPDLHPFVQEF